MLVKIVLEQEVALDPGHQACHVPKFATFDFVCELSARLAFLHLAGSAVIATILLHSSCRKRDIVLT